MTLDISFGIKNIIEGQGISIALTGMFIVFVALSLITLSIFLLPKILVFLTKFIPQKTEVQVMPGNSSTEADEILAGIGYVLHKSFKKNPPKR